MTGSIVRRLVVLVCGFVVISSCVGGVGFGVVGGQTTPVGNATGNATAGGSNTTGASQSPSTSLDADAQRNRTSAVGGVNAGLTGGNVSSSIYGNGSLGSGSASGGGLFGFSMRKDVIVPALNTTRQGLADGTRWILNRSMEVTVGTPVPQDDNNDGIVLVPTNEPWSNLHADFFLPFVFPLAVAFSFLGMVAKCGLMPWKAMQNPMYSQSQAFLSFLLTLVLIVFTVPIIAFLHQFIDVLATGFAPSTAELTQSTQGLMNLTTGSIFAVIAAFVIGFTEALGLAFIYALRYGALFVLPWFLPLLIPLAYNAPHKRLAGFASEMLWQYFGLLIQAFGVAVLFRAAYEMNWDFGFGGFIGLLISGFIFLAAAILPLLTSIGLFKAAPSIQTVATGTAGYIAGSRASAYSRQAAGQAARGGYRGMVSKKDDVSEYLSSDDSRSGSPHRGQTTINDYENRTHPHTGIPKHGKL